MNPFQQHVFYRGVDGPIHHILWDSSSGLLAADDWTSRTGAPLAAGDPAALATAGGQHVFFRGVDGRIHHIVWTDVRRRLDRDVWSDAAGAPPALGDPRALETPGQLHVFYRGAGGTVCHVLRGVDSGPRFFDDWTARGSGPPAAGDPAPLATTGQQHVFYRNSGGSVSHIFWDATSGALGHDDWTAGAGVPPVAGDLSVFETAGQQHVFYRGTDRSIRHVLWSPTTRSLHRDDWTARTGAPAAEGDPAAMVGVDGRQHVFYRASGGTVQHLLWDPASGGLAVDEWTAAAHAPRAAGRPVPLASPGQIHAFYRGREGAIDHIVRNAFTGAMGSDDWTSRSGAPAAAGDPATMLTGAYTWRVMPLGDSITEGHFYPGGYRVRLFETATRHGKRVTFVGTLSNGPADVGGVAFPPSHEGHSGKDIGFLTGIAPDAIRRWRPDIVLLMIGTNDVLQGNDLGHASSRFAILLDEILASGVARTIVARIPPIPALGAAPEVVRYNEAIAAVVFSRAAAGAPVSMVDMHTGFPPSLFGPDAIHPYQPGYEHMAAVWLAAIEPFLG